MFEETVVKLLEGEFICRTAYPDSFSFLEDESNRRQVDGYLTQIGRSLAATVHGQAYYAAHRTVGPNQRRQIESLFKEVKYDLFPVLEFLLLVMDAERGSQTLDAGDVIDFPRTLLQISENPSLCERLRGLAVLGKEFSSSGEASLNTLLQSFFKYMVNKGYLIKMDKGDRFKVTGKVDYFYEVSGFLSDNEQAIREAREMESEAETGKTGKLL